MLQVIQCPKITAHNLCLEVPDSWYWIVLTIAEDWKILGLKVFFSILCSLFCCEFSMLILSTTQKFGIGWTCSRTVKWLQHPSLWEQLTHSKHNTLKNSCEHISTISLRTIIHDKSLAKFCLLSPVWWLYKVLALSSCLSIWLGLFLAT